MDPRPKGMMASASSKGVARHSPSSRVATETRLLGCVAMLLWNRSALLAQISDDISAASWVCQSKAHLRSRYHLLWIL